MNYCWREISVRVERKCLVAVALLAVLAVVFGFAGAVPPLSAPSSSSSSSVTHFMYPPTYDSGWVGITDKAGRNFTIVHNLNTVNVTVDITGRTAINGGDHQRNLGGTGYTPGWSRTYGKGDTDGAYSLVQTSDGGYALAGHTYSSTTQVDFLLVKTAQTGQRLWWKAYGGTENEEASSVVQTSDGGYALAGHTYSFGAGYSDFWLIRTDQAGTLQWNKTYGGKGWEEVESMVQTSDGGYALAGRTSSFGAGGYDFWLIKTDAAGIMQWNRTYGGKYGDIAWSLVQTSDGGYALAGQTWSYGAGDNDFYLVKTDSAGNMQWNRTYGGTGDDYAYSVVQTSDGGYALAGHTNSFGAGYWDFWLIKTNATGTMEWNRTYGGGDDDEAHSVVQTGDGGYALAGWTYSYGPGWEDFWLVKTDAAGNVQWNKTYGGANTDYCESVVQTVDGGYALAGITSSFGAGGYDFWLVKTDVESGLAWTDSTNNTITLYRGRTDLYWNYVRVRIWLIKEPTWQYGDLDMDGDVDPADFYIFSQHYGKTFSALGLGGIIATAGIYTIKKRKQQK